MPPIQTAFEAEPRECFRALMWALSYPGQIMTLPMAGEASSLTAFATGGRALAHRHRLLLMDEPTASLDVHARAALVQRLRELKAQGVAMIGVFHHPEDVRELIDGENGRVCAPPSVMVIPSSSTNAWPRRMRSRMFNASLQIFV